MSILVSNIPEEISSEVIKEEFSIFGDIRLNYFGRFAYIEYKDLKSARNALLAWNGRIMAGNVLKIEYHFEQPEPEIPSQPLNKSLPITILPQENPKLNEGILISQTAPFTQEDNNHAQFEEPLKESEDINEDLSDSIEVPKPSSKSKKFIDDVCDALIEANPTIFRVKKKNKKKPSHSLIACELCNKDFKKSSIRQHITSKSHQSKLT